MGSSHTLDQLDSCFDDTHAIANAGLLLPATLAERLGIEQAADALIDLGEQAGAPAPSPSGTSASSTGSPGNSSPGPGPLVPALLMAARRRAVPGKGARAGGRGSVVLVATVPARSVTTRAG
jgi:hypothetical protein